MAEQDLALMAHLMRRAGFGASYEELERRAAVGYGATVNELLNPESQPDLEMDILERRFIDWKDMNALEVNQAYWTYRMINTQRPLQEKVALFWHGFSAPATPSANTAARCSSSCKISGIRAWASSTRYSGTWPATRLWSSTWTTA